MKALDVGCVVDWMIDGGELLTSSVIEDKVLKAGTNVVVGNALEL